MANEVFSTAQRLSADALVSLYTMDATAIGGPIYRFTPGTLPEAPPSQLITNPFCAKNTTGWSNSGAQSANGAFIAAKTAWPYYALEGEGSCYAHRIAYTSGGYTDISWSSSSNAARPAAAPGERWEFSAYLLPGQGAARVWLAFMNDAGAIVSGGSFPGPTVTNAAAFSDGRKLEAYTRVSVRGVAPAGTTRVWAFIRMFGTGGQGSVASDVKLLFTMAQLGQVPADSVAPVAFQRYSPGGTPIFGGLSYTPAPIEAEGFEWSGRGPVPRPTLRISNIGNLAGNLAIAYGDLLGAKLTRLRTFARYLDGMPHADSGSYFEPDIWYFDRKAHHTPTEIAWELASILDQEGRRLPGRQMIRDVCTHTYRRWAPGFDYAGVSCPYVGSTYFKADGTTTLDPALDTCGRRLTDCRLRFPSPQPLPTRAFPGMGLDHR